MNDIKICTSQECSITCVPNIFIDRYMHNANGEFVKIYLYLLRALSQRNGNISISQIADKLELTENDVRRSLLYWEKKNLLHLEYDNSGNISCINVISPEDQYQAEVATLERFGQRNVISFDEWLVIKGYCKNETRAGI